jgi:hypothetical protein
VSLRGCGVQKAISIMRICHCLKAYAAIFADEDIGSLGRKLRFPSDDHLKEQGVNARVVGHFRVECCSVGATSGNQRVRDRKVGHSTTDANSRNRQNQEQG